MSNDIELLGDSDEIAKIVKSKVKGLKATKKEFSAADKEADELATMLDRMERRQKQTKFAAMHNALRSMGMSNKGIRGGGMSYMASLPANAGMAYLLKNNASPQAVAAYVRAAGGGPAMRANLAAQQQAAAAQQQAAQNLANSPWANAGNSIIPGMGTWGHNLNNRTQPAMDMATQGLRVFAGALGTAVVGLRAASSISSSSRESRLELSNEKISRDKVIQDLHRKTGISINDLTVASRITGKEGDSVMAALADQASNPGRAGLSKLMFGHAMQALSRGSSVATVQRMVGENDLVGLSREARRDWTSAAIRGQVGNRARGDALTFTPYASEVDEITAQSERVNKGQGGIMSQIARYFIGGEFEDRGEAVRAVENTVTNDAVIDFTKGSGRRGGGGMRETQFDSVSRRNQQPTVIYGDIKAAPTTNPVMGVGK